MKTRRADLSIPRSKVSGILLKKESEQAASTVDKLSTLGVKSYGHTSLAKRLSTAHLQDLISESHDDTSGVAAERAGAYLPTKAPPPFYGIRSFASRISTPPPAQGKSTHPWHTCASDSLPNVGYLQRKCSICEQEKEEPARRIQRHIDNKDLTVGPADDEYEREADRIASLVMAGSNVRVHGRIRRGTHVQGDGNGAKWGPITPPSVNKMLQTEGAPLNAITSTLMETRMGYDFSKVRIHTGVGADASARALGALAYTVGRHIAFQSGQYSPATKRGQRLLAHELAHVCQQGKAEPLHSNKAAYVNQESALVPIIQRSNSSSAPADNAATVFTDLMNGGFDNLQEVYVERVQALPIAEQGQLLSFLIGKERFSEFRAILIHVISQDASVDTAVSLFADLASGGLEDLQMIFIERVQALSTAEQWQLLSLLIGKSEFSDFRAMLIHALVQGAHGQSPNSDQGSQSRTLHVTTDGCEEKPYNERGIIAAVKVAFSVVRDSKCIKSQSLRDEILDEFDGLNIDCEQGDDKDPCGRAFRYFSKTINIYPKALDDSRCGPLVSTILHEIVHLTEWGIAHGDLANACEMSCFGYGSGTASKCK